MNSGSFKKGEKRPNQGRPPGSLNKTTATIKEMVIQALDEAGGVEYLVRQAKDRPAAFLLLVGKVMPVQIEGANGGALEAKLTIEYVRPNPVA